MNNKQMNVLLADDDADDCFFFEKALREISIPTHFTTVNDGERLMDHLSRNEDKLPDVLFLDLNMPRKSGFECLNEIVENINLKDLPVIIFSTSYTQDPTYEKSLINVLYKMGAKDYVRKPGNFAKLKELINQSLAKLIEKNPDAGQKEKLNYPPPQKKRSLKSGIDEYKTAQHTAC